MIQVTRLSIPDVLEITPPRLGDHRGFFSEVWNAAALAEVGLAVDFVQDNHSFSAPAGVLRGLHYQIAPMAQDKLVRVVRGSILDVAVDIRPGSSFFGRWVSLEVSAHRWNQIFVPKGFAHGFVTLEPNTEVIYKVSAPYALDHERSIRYDDPQIGIEWPIAADHLILSEKDRTAPLLKDSDVINFQEQA